MAVKIIGEIGINHNRSLDAAKKLSEIAKESGADVVKTQLESPTEYCLSYDETLKLYRHCEAIGIPFACTAFDVPTLCWLLENTKMAFVKVASCDADNLPLLEAVWNSGLPIIQSIRNPLEDLPVNEVEHARYLHVVPLYPCPLDHCNLKRVAEQWCSGLSDHSGNPLVPALAVALGAEIIECHLTLDREQEGPDHKASLDPWQFKQMVQMVRDAETACRAPVNDCR